MRIFLSLVLVAFGALSASALVQVGYFGILQAGTASIGAWQVLMDLVITSIVALIFIWRDARQRGRAFWPFAVITLALGSFGPLLYLLLEPGKGKPSEQTT